MSGGPVSSGENPDDSSQEPQAGTPAERDRSPWWLAAVTFVVGLVVGIVTVGLLNAGTPDFVTANEPEATDAATSPAPTSASAGVQAQVNAACLRVINEAQDTNTVLADVLQATKDVDLRKLDEIVRQLQAIQPRAARDLKACRVDTGVTGGSTGGPTSEPTSP